MSVMAGFGVYRFGRFGLSGSRPRSLNQLCENIAFFNTYGSESASSFVCSSVEEEYCEFHLWGRGSKIDLNIL